MDIELLKDRILRLKNKYDSWPLISFKNIFNAKSEALQEILNIIEEEENKENIK